MKREVQKKGFIFIGKSLLWSLLLYVALMLACNWDEVSNAVSGNAITKINGYQLVPASPGTNNPGTPDGGLQPNTERHTSVIKGFVTLVRIVSGIAEVND